jgi:hypothetical protein
MRLAVPHGLEQAPRERWRHALERLVEQDDSPPVHEAAGEGHELLLAAAQQRGTPGRQLAQLRH